MDHVSRDIEDFEQWLDEQLSEESDVMRYYASPEFTARQRLVEAQLDEMQRPPS